MRVIQDVFSIKNTNATSVKHDIQQGIPCPKGVMFTQSQYALVDTQGVTYNTWTKPSAFWSDNSIKWLLVGAEIDCAPDATLTFHLSEQLERSNHTKMLTQVTQDTFQIDSNTQRVLISPWSMSTALGSVEFALNVETLGTEMNVLPIHQAQESRELAKITVQEQMGHLAPYCAVVNISRYFSLPALPAHIHYQICIKVLFASDTLVIEHTLHNPNAAHHPNGQWDLGDAHSVIVKKWDTTYSCTTISNQTGSSNTNTLPASSGNQNAPLAIAVRKTPVADFFPTTDFTLRQLSSGGDNFTAKTHLDLTNNVATEVECVLENYALSAEKRSNPTVKISRATHCEFLTQTHFWETFPSALRIQNDTVCFSMIDAALGVYNELQPGEKWTQKQSLTTHAPVLKPVTITLLPEYVAQTGVLDRFAPALVSSRWQKLLAKGLDPTQGFFAKREQADIFGIRHFGEVYADHETAGYQGDDIFISFYNNQYDPLQGFLTQWLTTGKAEYFALADELATHINHIDIYHTCLDKPEYCGGLFWHTDHYLPASTASHRTYSKHHKANAYEDHAGGGGPGGQHCYTQGLTLHYLLTGCQKSKDSVFSLYEWVTHFYEGDGTLLGWMLAWRNSQQLGFKNIRTEQYPLDRGTANYVNAVLDMFILTQKESYLRHAFYIISHTLGPEDNLVQRDLDDVERRWFYTVMLQALGRCHRLLEREGLAPDYQAFLIQTLMHYGDWMLHNEQPYLNRPEILEYPNQTWSGQDIRKIDILAYLAALDTPNASAYRAKAQTLENQIFSALQNSDELHYSRIQALIMQNYGGIEAYSTHLAVDNDPSTTSELCTKNWADLALNKSSQWSIKQEIANLKKRSHVAAKWIP